jgi:hypothetical protein
MRCETISGIGAARGVARGPTARSDGALKLLKIAINWLR